jgi:hypothetical protein
MTLSEYMTQARHDRSARRAARGRRDELVRELQGYSTPAERLELEMLAARSGRDGEVLLDLLSSLPTSGTDAREPRSAWRVTADRI